MYVILTSKPGQFRTEAGEGLRPIEHYDYLFCGRLRAHFVVAELQAPTRVRVVDETEPVTVNLVPSKFLESFETLADARRELDHLCRFGDLDARLVRQDAAPTGA